MPELEPFFFFSAFLAGVLMFLAPCTLPLLPAYLGFISGVTEKELQDSSLKKRAKKHVLQNSVMFVFGFSSILMFTGMSAGFLGGVVSPLLLKICTVAGGLLVIVFGLFMMRVINLSFLVRERRLRIPTWLTIGSPTSAFLLGSAFALGWTPCIGPVYGTILIYVSTTQTALTGLMLLAVFAAGFSVSLIALAFLIGHAGALIEKALPYIHAVSFVGGVALVILGVTLLIGNTPLTDWFFYIFEYLDLESVLMPYL